MFSIKESKKSGDKSENPLCVFNFLSRIGFVRCDEYNFFSSINFSSSFNFSVICIVMANRPFKMYDDKQFTKKYLLVCLCMLYQQNDDVHKEKKKCNGSIKNAKWDEKNTQNNNINSPPVDTAPQNIHDSFLLVNYYREKNLFIFSFRIKKDNEGCVSSSWYHSFSFNMEMNGE